MMMERRSFLLGLGATLAAPAIVRAESLMKVAKLRQDFGGPMTATEILMRQRVAAWAIQPFMDEILNQYVLRALSIVEAHGFR